jgi:hypothetical protein
VPIGDSDLWFWSSASVDPFASWRVPPYAGVQTVCTMVTGIGREQPGGALSRQVGKNWAGNCAQNV